MTALGDVPPPLAKGRAVRWFSRVFLPLGTVVLTLQMIDKRGVAMGVLVALTFGTLAAFAWIPPRVAIRWSSRHPLLDGLLFTPILFCALAYLTPLSLLVCLGITVIGTALMLGVVGWRLARSRRAPMA
ncbi:hypothetical protein [Nonomuraea basaltis]|uniref:hypothetical protein n=1 Tax=Nonomuraea basaltis TaxID=2495887 RepID=UPI00110C6FAC|nr:hypothetical protein [Nonomuraea basaltis]